MASLYRKARSPYWFLQTTLGGKRINKSTKLRADDRRQTAQAQELCASSTAKELHKHNGSDGGWSFVERFLKEHCSNEKTAQIYRLRWQWIQLWLTERRLGHASSIRFEHASEYIEWRTAEKAVQQPRKTSRTVRRKEPKKPVGRNSAIYDVKLLSMILDRAVRLGLCERNVLLRAGLKKDTPPEKPEITDAQFKTILAELDKPETPEWMKISFLISMHTGCRLGETCIPMDCLDFKRGTISFPNPKGGRGRAFSVPMPEALVPLLEGLQDGRTHTLEFPFRASLHWSKFFKSHGMSKICFHCLRVTFVTRLARAGVSQPLAMRLVNHSSTLVHRIYQRLSVEDVRGVSVNLFSEIGS